ncbi:amidohydrolase family protein [Pelomyxa schiedti]|nr:amidohydrolase family protein [Pelomyxa schiedti]
MASSVPCACVGEIYADIVVVNAKVVTMTGFWPGAEEAPRSATGFAVFGNRLGLVGGSVDDILKHKGPRTRVIDARGATVMPSFTDSHAHLLVGATRPLELSEVMTKEELRTELLSEYEQVCQRDPSGEKWVVASHAQYELLRDIDRHWFDTFIPDRGVAIMSVDLHTVWANTRALREAGLMNSIPSNITGVVVVDATGVPTGEVREMDAYAYLLNFMGGYGWALANGFSDPSQAPALDPVKYEQVKEEVTRLAVVAQKEFLSEGVAAVHMMDGCMSEMQMFLDLQKHGQLALRVWQAQLITPSSPLSLIVGTTHMQRASQGKVKSGFCKFFLDGVVETKTAATIEDYEGNPGNKGSFVWDLGKFHEAISCCDNHGLEAATHCVGDAAVRAALDTYESVMRNSTRHDHKFRIEHLEMVNARDLARLAELKVTASMQPLHYTPLEDATSWIRYAGLSRFEQSWPWKSLYQLGANVIFGSDWPIVDCAVFQALHACMARENLPQEQVKPRLLELLSSYTVRPALVEQRSPTEPPRGVIKDGAYADFIVLDRDIFADDFPANHLHFVSVLITCCDGKVEYERSD